MSEFTYQLTRLEADGVMTSRTYRGTRAELFAWLCETALGSPDTPLRVSQDICGFGAFSTDLYRCLTYHSEVQLKYLVYMKRRYGLKIPSHLTPVLRARLGDEYMKSMGMKPETWETGQS